MEVIKGHKGGYSCNAATFPLQFYSPCFPRISGQDKNPHKIDMNTPSSAREQEGLMFW